MQFKKLATSLVAGALVVSLAACGGGSGTSTQGASDSNSASKTEAKSDAPEAKQSKYAVTIDDCKQGKDYEGKPCAIISFTFTNNSDEAIAMASAVNIEVYQDGTQQDSTISDKIDSSNYMNKVKPGASIKVQLPYNAPSKSDLEVDVTELVSINNTKLATKTFQLS